jgi:surfeit locus 1 family protein
MIRRWIPAVFLLLVVGVTASLGSWQVRRGAEKDALQAQRDAARAAAPIRPATADPGLPALDGRRVALSGRFDESRTVFLDNRTRQGVAGFHVLTPMQLDGGGAWVIVLRGWVARDLADRTRLPTLPALPDAVRIEGFAQATLPQPMLLAAAPPPQAGDRIWQRYEPEVFRNWSGRPVVDGLVRQTSDAADGLARDWVEPGSGADKHRAYAFQWYAMSLVAAVALAVVLVRGRRQREA